MGVCGSPAESSLAHGTESHGARLAYARGQPTSSARGGMQKPTATFKRQGKGASMGKKTILFLAIAIVAMVILPATAFGAGLINEYGMHYAGQSTCTGCHGAEMAKRPWTWFAI